MTFYALMKLLHVLCVAISGSLFAYRFAHLSRRPEKPLARVLTVLPHVNDTLLLSAAIAMLVITGLNPFVTPWLLAKIVALLGYILLGAICLRAAPGSRRQWVTFIAAMSAFAYIVLVALSKSALLF